MQGTQVQSLVQEESDMPQPHTSIVITTELPKGGLMDERDTFLYMFACKSGFSHFSLLIIFPFEVFLA